MEPVITFGHHLYSAVTVRKQLFLLFFFSEHYDVTVKLTYKMLLDPISMMQCFVCLNKAQWK